MKVLHLINTLSAGGAELHLLTLCRHLKRAGIDVVVAYLKEATGSRSLRADFEETGIRVVELGAARRFDPRCLFRLQRLDREEQPDLLHTHLPRADFAGTVGNLLSPSVRWIASVHDIHTHWSGSGILPLFFFLWRRADRVIAISQAVRDWLVRAGRIRAERVSVIHYGIEVERFAGPEGMGGNRRELGTSAVIGSVGRFESRKGHETLIRAMSTLLQGIPDARLLIAGSDPWGYGRTLRVLIDEMGLNGCIRLVGFQQDVVSFLHSLDVFAFASRTEGFGQVLIEAMAAGKPVVASRVPPITEIVVDGETGLLVEPDRPEAFSRALVWLLTHPTDAQRMGSRGRERVRAHFSAERMAAETFSLYRTVLGQLPEQRSRWHGGNASGDY